MESPLASVVLEQLQPLFVDPDFDTLFERLTEGESKSARFLLKMELNRIWSPCIRIMDMRSKGYPCQMVQYGGIQHYLGEHDQTIFQHALALYQQRYTTGVYETVMANVKPLQNQVNEAKQANSTSRLQIRTLEFGSYHQGREERIHYSSPVMLQLANGKTVKAKTSNLSVNGIRIALLEPCSYELGQSCFITFSGIQKEQPENIIFAPVRYQIKGDEHQEQQSWLRLSCEDPRPEFKEFLTNFIQQNKTRYRVSIDFAFTATEIKGFEQFYLPRLIGLPLFFSHDKEIKLEYVLKTENNQQELEYWRNERNADQLAGLFTQARMNKLLSQSGKQKSVLIYCFTHTIRSHIYFYSATEEELTSKGLKELFFSVGSKRNSWRVYNLSLQAIDHYLNLDKLIDSDINMEQYRQGLVHQLQQFRYVGQLTPINLENHVDDYQIWQPAQNDANELHCFGHQLDAQPFQIDLLYYAQLRREPRYMHKTPAVVKLGEHALIGWTRDISTLGLQVELEAALLCKIGDVIELSLPKMQDLIKKMDLSDLKYRIVNYNNTRTVLHLAIEGNEHTHTGREFFQMLIEQNQKKLTMIKEQRHYRGMANSLRNLFVNYQFNYALYVDRHYASKLGILGIGQTAHSLDNLLLNAERTKADLYPLLKGDILKQALIVPLHQAHREDRPQTIELYVLHKKLPQGKQQNLVRLYDDFINTNERIDFVNKAVGMGEFYSVQLHISRTGRPDMEYLAKELHYIAKYAIHKAKQLEEALWSVVGVCDVIDTTEATLQRLNIKH
jgi:hypothetical protein